MFKIISTPIQTNHSLQHELIYPTEKSFGYTNSLNPTQPKFDCKLADIYAEEKPIDCINSLNPREEAGFTGNFQIGCAWTLSISQNQESFTHLGSVN